MSLPENETKVNLKSASFIVMMLLHEGLTHIHSQIKPRVLLGESFPLIICSKNTHIFVSVVTVALTLIVAGRLFVPLTVREFVLEKSTQNENRCLLNSSYP